MSVPSPSTSSRRARVLGVDPGLTRCGLGIVEGSPSAPVFVVSDCIRTSAEQPIATRLQQVHEGIAAMIETHRPDAVAVERVLFSANVRTAMATGQAAGVALLAAAQAGLEVTPYSPNEVKQTVTGSGAADKGAVARLVAAQLGLEAPPSPPDVADALAVALTHLAFRRMDAAVAGSAAASTLAAAQRAAAAVGRGGWEARLADRGFLPGAGR